MNNLEREKKNEAQRKAVSVGSLFVNINQAKEVYINQNKAQIIGFWWEEIIEFYKIYQIFSSLSLPLKKGFFRKCWNIHFINFYFKLISGIFNVRVIFVRNGKKTSG